MSHEPTFFTATHAYLRLIATPRRALLIAIVLLCTGILFWLASLPDHHSKLSRPFDDSQVRLPPSEPHSTTATLGVAKKMYMLTLPARKDRRLRMETLRKALGLQWTYVDGLQSTNELTQKIWEWVLRVREGEPTIISEDHPSYSHPLPGSIGFSWPDHIDHLVLSSTPIDFWSDTVWATPATVFNPTPYHPTRCAMHDYHILDIDAELPEHLILTRARIACWYSHISVIHNIANNKEPDLDSAYIILEDDIDMEKDIAQQLKVLWVSLPRDWDMVFLGHCWADEKKYPALPIMYPEPAHAGSNNKDSPHNTTRRINRLHPSNMPKCTHAYAVSKRGARRLLAYLRYPPFAYSRAVDQAISWLIETGKIKSYTVVPSLIIQTKEDNSDISPGTGGGWPERLVNGVLTGQPLDDESESA
ncbi:hypothetical protein AN958_01546 [Leucoagaricus sp. SymC.cos]|nr:hypothetical protein AN958_01546 [Leucoagaricus sp. SymC.cos]